MYAKKKPNVSSNCRVIGYRDRCFFVKLFAPGRSAPESRVCNSEHGSQTDQSLHVKGAQSVASWSLVLAGLVVGITVCVAIGYIVFLQPNPDSNVPDLPPSDAVVKTPPDETSSTQHLSETGTVVNHSKNEAEPESF